VRQTRRTALFESVGWRTGEEDLEMQRVQAMFAAACLGAASWAIHEEAGPPAGLEGHSPSTRGGFDVWTALSLASQDFTPTAEFQERRIEGWTVKVHRDVPPEALRLLETRLQDIARLVPARAVEELRKVPIWIGGRDGKKSVAQYHPNRGWLEKNGYNPEKAKAVDLGPPETLVQETRRQPFLVLHELSHAYHDRVLGFGHEAIRAAYEEAVRNGRYDSVLFWDGRRVKHYALTDPQEYFAEGTEAYFGTNDFYPFVRAELREHDPRLVEVLERVWGVR
jgi:hypothetical protein